MDTPNQRLADLFGMKLAIDFVLHLVSEYAMMLGGDPTRALVLLAASKASAQKLSASARPSAQGFLHNDYRKPTSIAGLARTLHLSPETVRRHVNALVESGHITRSPRSGIIVLAENLDRPEIMAAIERARVSYLKLKRALKDDV